MQWTITWGKVNVEGNKEHNHEVDEKWKRDAQNVQRKLDYDLPLQREHYYDGEE
jgi:hypothetical protein